MKMLEARFHPPLAERRDYIVVGHVIVEREGSKLVTRIKPACSLGRHAAPATMLATLRHLTRVAAPHPWERLQSLRCRHWTFVPLEPVRVADREGYVTEATPEEMDDDTGRLDDPFGA